jgi:hypothetical protein
MKKRNIEPMAMKLLSYDMREVDQQLEMEM